MIDQINIKSLKSISDILIDCSKLNLFVGTNSSGKSTALQSILLVSQNIEQKYGLNGPLVSLGEFREAKNFNVSENIIEVALIDDNNAEIYLSIHYDGEAVSVDLNASIEDYTNVLFYTDFCDGMNYNKQHIQYLSCNRIGSQDTYQKNLYKLNKFGINGEYAIDYLMEHGSDELEQALIKSMDSFTLLHQVNAWLKYIINANIMTEDVTGTDVVKARFSLIDGKNLRPKNVGSGISYLISIIILCLGSQKDDIILIENPEIHLHPLSQSRLCEFLYFVSKSGRQLFVETHSDHFFNGIRAGIATGDIIDTDVSVNFFKLNENNCTVNTRIQFGKRGKILNHVDNLFEQFDIDLNRMLGL